MQIYKVYCNSHAITSCVGLPGYDVQSCSEFKDLKI